MAEYSKLVITQTGRALIAKIIAGTGDIEFTKVCSSSAAYTEGELESLTELKEIRQTSLVSNVSRTNDVAIKIEAAFSNAELTEGYDMRTLGLYAVDPEEGEILYAVCIETVGSCYMPPCNGVTVSAASIQLYVAVGNTDHVSLEVDPGAFARIRDIRLLEEAMTALDEMLSNKVDKAEGKGLSENDYTTAEKDKLAGIATGICITPQGTAAKAVDCPDFELRDGARIMVTFNNGNTSNYMKLNVNGTGEYFAYFPIDGFRAYNNEAISKLIVAGCAYEFIFQEDGSNSKWVYCGVVSTAESIGALSKNDLSNSLGGPGIPIIQSAADSGGLMEIGKYIDFHDVGSQSDFDARLYCENGELVSTSPVRASLKGCAATIGNSGNCNVPMTFHYSGQVGQPLYVWGSNTGVGTDNYVWSPSNFNVNSAVKDGDGNVIADTYLKKNDANLSTNLARLYRGLTGVGWHRIAKFQYPDIAGSNACSWCNSCQMSIRKYYTSSMPEYYRLELVVGYANSEFKQLSGLGGNGASYYIKKVRHVKVGVNHFIDIYNSATHSSGNDIYVTLLDAISDTRNGAYSWELVDDAIVGDSEYDKLFSEVTLSINL